MDQSVQDRAVLLLVNGMSLADAERFCVSRGLSPEEARQAVAQARKRITITAEYAKDEHLGKAVMRLEDLYAQSIRPKDTRTALQAQRELNRLLDLYGGTDAQADGDGDGDDDAAQRLALIEESVQQPQSAHRGQAGPSVDRGRAGDHAGGRQCPDQRRGRHRLR